MDIKKFEEMLSIDVRETTNEYQECVMFAHDEAEAISHNVTVVNSDRVFDVIFADLLGVHEMHC